MLDTYRKHVEERAAEGVPPLPLNAAQVTDLVALLQAPPAGEEAFLVELLTERVPPGVDDASRVKAEFLAGVAKGQVACALISRQRAVELLGTMLGGYNVQPLIDLLDDAAVAADAASALQKTLLVFDGFDSVAAKAKAGNAAAQPMISSRKCRRPRSPTSWSKRWRRANMILSSAITPIPTWSDIPA